MEVEFYKSVEILNLIEKITYIFITINKKEILV